MRQIAARPPGLGPKLSQLAQRMTVRSVVSSAHLVSGVTIISLRARTILHIVGSRKNCNPSQLDHAVYLWHLGRPVLDSSISLRYTLLKFLDRNPKPQLSEPFYDENDII